MKKSIKKQQKNIIFKALILLFSAALLTSLCVLLSACNKKSVPEDTSPCYDINLELDGDKLLASQDVLFTAPDDINRIVFHIYANAFGDGEDAINISSAMINRAAVSASVYGDDKTLLSLPCSMSARDTCTISLEYEISIPRGNSRLGKTSYGYNLACFYPSLAVYSADGGWREDAYQQTGDPFFSESSSFYVSLLCDENLSVASSGKIIEESVVENKKSVYIEAENIRDFAMSVGKFNRISDSADLGSKQVDINYFFVGDKNANLSMERAKSALSVFSNAFGEYPYDCFTLAEGEIDGAGGMEYGTFALICNSPSYDIYLDTITHETAHQWWYNCVGNDQINAAWLDEGLAEFCTYYYYKLIGESDKYRSAMNSCLRSYSSFAALKSVGFDGRMDRPLSSFLTSGEYGAVVYQKGALLFDCLYEIAGEGAFAAALQNYFSSNLYSIADQAALCSAFFSVGKNVDGIVNSWVQDKIFISHG